MLVSAVVGLLIRPLIQLSQLSPLNDLPGLLRGAGGSVRPGALCCRTVPRSGGACAPGGFPCPDRSAGGAFAVLIRVIVSRAFRRSLKLNCQLVIN